MRYSARTTAGQCADLKSTERLWIRLRVWHIFWNIKCSTCRTEAMPSRRFPKTGPIRTRSPARISPATISAARKTLKTICAFCSGLSLRRIIPLKPSKKNRASLARKSRWVTIPRDGRSITIFSRFCTNTTRSATRSSARWRASLKSPIRRCITATVFSMRRAIWCSV